MRRGLITMLLVVLGCATVAGADPYGKGGHAWKQIHIDAALEVHNQWRCAHTPDQSKTPIMGWSDILAKKASCWAERMAAGPMFAHSKYTDCCFQDGGSCSYGENLAMSGGMVTSWSDQSLADAIKKNFKMWYDEVKDYNPKTATFSSGTGHFTQVVWAGSLAVGCGSAATASGSIYFSCNYLRAGNMMGDFKNNVFCSNGDGAPCLAYRSPYTCDLNQFYDAAFITWTVNPGSSASNPTMVAKNSHVDMVSLHAEKVCHTLRHDGGVPDAPTCSQTHPPCITGNHEDYVFLKDDDGKPLESDDLVVIKVIGCASAGHKDSSVATGYFKIDKPKAPGAPVYVPDGTKKIAKNSHVVVSSSGAQKVCYNVDQPTVDPTCTQSTQCVNTGEVDVIVDHDEELKVIGCVSDEKGGWLTSSVGDEKYQIETVDHRCDETFRTNWAGMMDWQCSSNCGAYLMAKYNAQYGYCSACKGAFASSVADAEAKNPGYFVFDHDGQRCSEFGKVAKCSIRAAAEEGNESTSAAGGWTTATTVVLVVGLVGIMAFFAVGVVVGKKLTGKKPQQQDASKFQNLADSEEQL